MSIYIHFLVLQKQFLEYPSTLWLSIAHLRYTRMPQRAWWWRYGVGSWRAILYLFCISIIPMPTQWCQNCSVKTRTISCVTAIDDLRSRKTRCSMRVSARMCTYVVMLFLWPYLFYNPKFWLLPIQRPGYGRRSSLRRRKPRNRLSAANTFWQKNPMAAPWTSAPTAWEFGAVLQSYNQLDWMIHMLGIYVQILIWLISGFVVKLQSCWCIDKVCRADCHWAASKVSWLNIYACGWKENSVDLEKKNIFWKTWSLWLDWNDALTRSCSQCSQAASGGGEEEQGKTWVAGCGPQTQSGTQEHPKGKTEAKGIKGHPEAWWPVILILGITATVWWN